MKKFNLSRVALAAILQLFFASSGLLHAGTTQTAMLKAFDRLCVQTKLNDEILIEVLKSYEIQEVTGPVLQSFSAGNTMGYFVKIDGDQIFVSVGENQFANGTVSKFCSITAQEGRHDQARKVIEENYNVIILDSIQQGLIELVTYKIQLAGYAGEVAFSVQTTEGFSALSMYDAFGMLEK